MENINKNIKEGEMAKKKSSKKNSNAGTIKIRFTSKKRKRKR